MGSRSGEINRDWGGETRSFRLGIGETKKLQEETGAGPVGMAVRCKLTAAALVAMDRNDFATLGLIGAGPFAEPHHVRFGMMQALLGAGVPMADATALMRAWFDDRPLSESLMVLHAACRSALLGPEDEPLGEREGEGKTTPSPKGGLDSPPTTQPAPSQA